MNTVFMGTPEIAVPALRLLAARTTVTCVVTQPDRPAGRGNALHQSAVKLAALELGLRVWQPETLRGAEAAQELAGAELFIVLAYGELLREPVLRLPRACINLHASLLPRWRGASPLQAAIRAGDATTGVTVMEMVRALDAGPIYLQRPIDLPPRATLPWLHDVMAAEAALALGEFLDAWPGIAAVPQNEAQVTTCRKLTTDDGRIDWSQDAAAIDRHIRAFTPAPGCWTEADRVRLRIFAASPEPAAGLAPGAVRVADGTITVGCGVGTLRIARLQAPGRKALDAVEFLRGNSLPAMFGGPSLPLRTER